MRNDQEFAHLEAHEEYPEGFRSKMKTQNEQWKAIADSNGEYHISDQGRVKSYKRGKERILKPSSNLQGYLHLGVRIKGKRKAYL